MKTSLRALCSLALFALAETTAAAAFGPIQLSVDATDAPRGIFRTHMVIPAAPGPLVLAYPKWIQGEHAPTGPIMQVAGLLVHANNEAIPWRRDPLDPFLVRAEVPAGVSEVQVELDYLSPPESVGGGGYGETPNATPHLLIVDWHDLLVYPQGPSLDDLQVRATLRLPAGWKQDSALTVAQAADKDGRIVFAPTSLYTLMDSPVFAGEIFRRLELGPAEAPVHLSIVADQQSSMAIPEERIAAYRHYREYHWLLALGDTLEHNGLEHHQSSDNRQASGMFTDEALLLRGGTLLPHEYVHSWNGKYRRPAGLAVRDAQEPLRTELLWVYEGLTRYLGDFLLTTRSGIRTVEQSREYAAWVAANQDRNRPGRSWRPLVDTAESVQFLGALPAAWTAYRRTLDYYDESMLIWLVADAVIREQSRGAKSLDDFCRAFFGGTTAPAVVPYTAEDVYTALNAVAPYDWRSFFNRLVYQVQGEAPLHGLEAAGWRLVYTDKPNEYQRLRARSNKTADESFSLGIWVKEDGKVDDVVISSPAWKAGLGPGMTLVAVDGRAWSPEILPEQIQAARTSKKPIEITARHGDVLKTFQVDYHEGERYPHLERIAERPDLLGQILAAKAK
jgi:predicted metalloprotease with PDZ domain